MTAFTTRMTLIRFVTRINCRRTSLFCILSEGLSGDFIKAYGLQ